MLGMLLLLPWGLLGCQEREPSDKPASRPASTPPGQALFKVYCAACHQPQGQGVAGGIPPLEQSEWLRGPESRLVRIVLHGVRGPIQVVDQTYNREMPGLGQILTDKQIAEVLTYVRQQYGKSNQPISAATVQQIRQATQGRSDYWTAEELLSIP